MKIFVWVMQKLWDCNQQTKVRNKFVAFGEIKCSIYIKAMPKDKHKHYQNIFDRGIVGEVNVYPYKILPVKSGYHVQV